MLIEKKQDSVKAKSIFEKRDKLVKYLVGKGYEPDLSWTAVKSQLPD
jgi:hypothetical protein